MMQPEAKSMDIRAELERTLSTGLDNARGFSFQKLYQNAPNPFLQVEGYGTVGLPLNPREAEAIKSKSRAGQASPFGATQEPRMVVDATKVAFANPQWAGFMDGVVNETCKILGVNHGASSVRCQLSELLLDGNGSNLRHFYHVGVGKDDVFAVVVVVLPSEFTGGETVVSHGGTNVAYNYGAASPNVTTVMAWHTDVTLGFESIKTGHRLALSYNLIHTAASPRPAVFDGYGFMEEVTRILRSWSNSATSGIPDKLVCLLDHWYSVADLRDSAFKGADGVKVELLRQVVQQAGFTLGMATVVCRLSGEADNDPDDSDCDMDHLDFANVGEVDSGEMTFEAFVDLSGDKLLDDLTVDSTETIPADIATIVEGGDHYHQEHWGDMEFLALERRYRRSVLVIWPNQYKFKVIYCGTGLKLACMRLESDAASSPTDDSRKLVDFVLLHAGASPTIVIPSVCRAAILWKDWDLWNSTLLKFFWGKDQLLLGNSDLLNALRTFGFESTRETFEHALRTAPDNQSQLQLFSAIESSLEQDNEIEKMTISSWLKQGLDAVLRNLRKPGKDEVKFVVSSSLSYGGTDFLVECIIPQFIELAGPTSLLTLALTIFNLKLPSDELPKKAELIYKVIEVVVSKLNFFVPKTAANRHYEDPNLTPLRKCLELCYAVQCSKAVTLIVDKAWTTGMSDGDAQDRVKSVILPLLSFIADLRSKSPSTFPKQTTTTLARITIETLLASIGTERKGITTYIMQSLVNAVASVEGGIGLIATMIVPRILAPEVSADLQIALAAEMHSNVSKLTVDDEYHGPDVPSMIKTLTNKFADRVVLNTVTTVTSALYSCMNLEASEACAKIRVLIPAMPRLRSLASPYNKLRDQVNVVFQMIVTHWVAMVLGPKPAQDPSFFVSALPQWTCTCAPCQRVKSFLENPKFKSPSIRIGKLGVVVKDHVESELNEHVKSAVTCSVPPAKRVGLQVDLSEAFVSSLKWATNQKDGLRVLRSISTDENELKLVLGVHYPKVLEALNVERVNEDSTTATPGTAGPSTEPHPGEPSAKKRRLG